MARSIIYGVDDAEATKDRSEPTDPRDEPDFAGGIIRFSLGGAHTVETGRAGRFRGGGEHELVVLSAR